VSKIQWSEPPAAVYRGSREEFFEALAKRPGKWAVFVEGKRNYFSARGYHMARHPGLEFATRRQPDGTYTTWARFAKRRRG
jgi:hypothetical protein